MGDIPALIANLQAQWAQQHAAMLVHLEQLHQDLIDQLKTFQRLLPMQLKNAAASLDAPLHYPADIVVDDQFPRTKRELLNLTTANADHVSQALGLQVLAANRPVAARQQHIIDYLGCGI